MPAAAFGEGSPLLDAAVKQMDDADFEGAQSTLERALAEPDLTDAERVEVLRRLGEVRVFLGRLETAGEAFNRLLLSDPDYRMPDAADPRALELFDAVRAAFLRDRRPLVLEPAPVPRAAAGAPVEVSARIENLPNGHPALLFWRRAGDGDWSHAEMAPRADGAYAAVVPALRETAGPGYDVEYFIEVRDREGLRVMGRGSRVQPLRFGVAPPPPPWYASPWLWGGALVVAAGAGAAALVVLGQGEEVRVVVKLP